MAYGVGSARSAKVGSVGKIGNAQSTDCVQSSWRVLNETCRLAAVERALNRETDFGDMTPIVL